MNGRMPMLGSVKLTQPGNQSSVEQTGCSQGVYKPADMVKTLFSCRWIFLKLVFLLWRPWLTLPGFKV